MRLEEQIEQIRRDIADDRYTTAAKDSTAVIEFAHREIFRRSVAVIDSGARRRVLEREQQIGGPDRGVEEFTLGELVRLFREAKLFAAYSEATGVGLRAITMVDFREVVELRNRMAHASPDFYEATRGEAQLCLHCVENLLEAFGILSLEAAGRSGEAVTRQVGNRSRQERPGAIVAGSTYRADERGESARLDEQAVLTRDFDAELFDLVLAEMPDQVVGLDLGCANGMVTADRYLRRRERFSAVIGVDNDAACIQRAAEAHPGIEFATLDLEGVDAADRLGEILAPHIQGGRPVLASLLVVLHHVAAPIRVLKMLRSALPRGSRIVIRTIDEGSIMAFPDTARRVERVVDLGVRYADGTDRHHGRKVHHQLSRAGFRGAEVRVQPYMSSAMDDDGRRSFFAVECGFRENLHRRALGRSEQDVAPGDGLEELREDIDEIEMDFDDPGFFYLMSWFGGIGRL